MSISLDDSSVHTYLPVQKTNFLLQKNLRLDTQLYLGHSSSREQFKKHMHVHTQNGQTKPYKQVTFFTFFKLGFS